MLTILGLIGFVVFAISLSCSLIGLFRNSNNFKSMALKGFGVGCSLFLIGSLAGCGKKETPITPDVKEKYKHIAARYSMQENEYVDLLKKMDEVVDLRRFKIDSKNNWEYVCSLSDEIPYRYRLFYGVEKDSKTGHNLLRGVSISPDTSNEQMVLYDSQNKEIKKIDIKTLFITKDDIKEYRKILENEYSSIKELKGVDSKKIKNVGEYYAVAVPNAPVTFNNSKVERSAVFGYMHVISYEKNFYGGSNNYCLKIIALFDSNDRHKPKGIFAQEEKVFGIEPIRREDYEKEEFIKMPGGRQIVLQFYLIDNNWRFISDSVK